MFFINLSLGFFFYYFFLFFFIFFFFMMGLFQFSIGSEVAFAFFFSMGSEVSLADGVYLVAAEFFEVCSCWDYLICWNSLICWGLGKFFCRIF